MLTFKKPTNWPKPKQKTKKTNKTQLKQTNTPAHPNATETEENKSSQGDIKQFLKKVI